ncbi:MAG TPA: translesion error-prone DNA polymerase V autoproteolytic subunit [Bacteroidales bacterium]|nr:translesion error-prone DNA polymerase V autoproteolytic subunit [Bacteroidales bacterium]
MSSKKVPVRIPEQYELFVTDASLPRELPLFVPTISAGFPSPADDFIDRKLDLNEYLVRNQPATFLVKVQGTSMENAGILDGDILVVDRSLEPSSGKIVIGVIDGEFTVKRIEQKAGKFFLMPENDSFKPIEITPDMDFKIWGIVTFAIHKL